MKRFKWLSALMMCLLLSVTVYAAGSIDPDHATSVTIHAVCGEVPVANMRFAAVPVASMDESGELTILDAFSEYRQRLDIRGQNDAAWQEMAQTLELDLAGRSEFPLEAVAVTDESGTAQLRGLPMGLYLIISEGVEQDGGIYQTAAFFVSLPEQDTAHNEWNYDVVANAKPEKKPLTADYTVEKIWKDSCHPDGRPDSITVELLRNGQVYDTITLPEDGRWRHTWENLDANYKWAVREKAVQGYAEPETCKDGTAFTITNTCNKTDQPSSGSLPQTGQLWWPVPILLLAGLTLVIAGLIRRKSDEE